MASTIQAVLATLKKIIAGTDRERASDARGILLDVNCFEFLVRLFKASIHCTSFWNFVSGTFISETFPAVYVKGFHCFRFQKQVSENRAPFYFLEQVPETKTIWPIRSLQTRVSPWAELVIKWRFGQ